MRWTPGWMPGATRSPSTSRLTSSAMYWPIGSRKSEVNVDATRMSQAFTGNGYIQNIITGEVNSFIARYRDNSVLPVELAVRMRFNPNLEQERFGAVMAIINNITMLAIVLTGSALIREREHGTIEHLLVMPITPFEIMLAKIWSMGLGGAGGLRVVTDTDGTGDFAGAH